MSNEKKKIRATFRDAVFIRDKYACVMCGAKDKSLDAHHICDRSLIINGGYVAQNGISLCPDCHQKAEIYHSTGKALENFAPEDLYKKINFSYEKAVEASKKLKG